MPSHQARREPLPKGYQFGDAASSSAMQALDDSDGSIALGRTIQSGDGRVLFQLGDPKFAIHKTATRYDWTAEVQPFDTNRDPGDETAGCGCRVERRGGVSDHFACEKHRGEVVANAVALFMPEAAISEAYKPGLVGTTKEWRRPCENAAERLTQRRRSS